MEPFLLLFIERVGLLSSFIKEFEDSLYLLNYMCVLSGRVAECVQISHEPHSAAA